MAEASLECYTRREGRTEILALEGTLDVATAPQAAEALQRFLADRGNELVLDTSRLDFIDSKGVGVLLHAAKAARDASGMLYLYNPALPVRKILEMCGLAALFPAPPAELLEPEPPAIPAPTPARSMAAAARPAAARAAAPAMRRAA